MSTAPAALFEQLRAEVCVLRRSAACVRWPVFVADWECGRRHPSQPRWPSRCFRWGVSPRSAPFPRPPCWFLQCTHGGRSCEDFMHFMSERAKLEDSYAKALNKLARHGVTALCVRVCVSGRVRAVQTCL